MGTKEVASSPTSLPQDAKAQLTILSFIGSEIPDNYYNVIIARWLTSLKKYNRYFKRIDDEAYFKQYQLYIKAILKRPNIKVRIAALKENEDVVFGWSVFEDDILHYVFIFDPFQGQRISYDLIPKGIKWVTHLTRCWEDYLGNKKYRKVKFNPFIY